MSCEECRKAIRTRGAWNQFNGAHCKWCSARRIQFIKKLKGLRDQLAARCTAALQEAVARGWNEKEIRALVAGDMAVEPAAQQDVRKSS